MLIVIESPNKTKKIAEYSGVKVMATVGHVKDLPAKSIGVDPVTYEPTFVGTDRGADILKRIVEASSGQDVVIATDPDREGYAIGMHVYQAIKTKAKSIRRAEIREINSTAVKAAISGSVAFEKTNFGFYDAFLGRRVGDRIVGYGLSPIASRCLGGKYSVGRVQSPALWLVVVREREIKNFKPEPYWDVTASIRTAGGDFTAEYINNPVEKESDGARIVDETLAAKLANITKAEGKEQKQNPKPPFTTVDLQAAASASLHISPEKTMSLAQELFAAGLISYHRTDSYSLADDWTLPIQDMVRKQLSSNHVLGAPVKHKSKASQAEAHEAIRPSGVYPVTDIHSLIVKEGLKDDHERLLELIWRRAVSSQMSPATFNTTQIEMEAGGHRYKASGKLLKFEGFRAVWTYNEAKETVLPVITAGDKLPIVNAESTRKMTKAPGRYSEATMVKELEKRGVGRPSTYASITMTLKSRGYVKVEKEMLHATQSGEALIAWLEKDHPWIIDCGFTSEMETFLDTVEEGKASWKDFIRTIDGRVGGITAGSSSGTSGGGVLTPKQIALIQSKGDAKALAALEANDFAVCRKWLDGFFASLKKTAAGSSSKDSKAGKGTASKSKAKAKPGYSGR